MIKERVNGAKGRISLFTVNKETGEKTPIFLNHPNLLTDSGRDWMHNRLYGSHGGIAKWIAFTTDGAAASSSDTILTNEIVGAGLLRSEATVTHTPGSSETMMSIELEATSSINGIKKVGLFTSLSPFPDSVLVHIATFPIEVNVVNGTLLNLEWIISIS